MTQVGNPALRQGGRYGEAASFGSTLAGNTNSYLVSPETLRYPGSGRRTYFVSFMARSVTANFNRFFQHNTGSGGDGAGLEGAWALDSSFSYVFSHGSAVAQCKSTAVLPIGRWTSAAVSMILDGTNNWLVYVDGTRTPTLYNQAPAASGNQVPQISTRVAVGNRPSDTLRSFDGQIGIQAWFDSQLSDAEIASLHANPNQLLDSGLHMPWAPVVASAATVYRPGSDVAISGWTATPTGTLADRIGELTLDRDTYITSPNLVDPATFTWTPVIPAGFADIDIDIDRTGGAGQVRIVLLDAVGSQVGATAWQAASPTPTTYTFTGVAVSALSTQFRIEVQ